MRIIDTIKTFYRDHKKGVSIALLVLAALLVASLIALFIYNAPKPAQKVSYKYSPINACNLLTMRDAHTLLGKDVIGSPVSDPNVSSDIATSNCSYTDENNNQAAMKVVALAVLSAVDDTGIQTVKDEFAAKKSGAITVADLGDDAYFDQSLGQLNILKDKAMLRISYGVGAAPQNNTLEDVTTVARLALANLTKK